MKLQPRHLPAPIGKAPDREACDRLTARLLDSQDQPAPKDPGPAPAPKPPSARAVKTTAAQWLAEALGTGPRPGKALKAEAAADGIKPRTLYRAAQRLGVVRNRGGWALPDVAKPEDTDQAKAEQGHQTPANQPKDAPAHHRTSQEAASASPPIQNAPETANASEGLTEALDALAFAAEALSKAARLVRRHVETSSREGSR